MGSYNNWDDDDALYDWGGEFAEPSFNTPPPVAKEPIVEEKVAEEPPVEEIPVIEEPVVAVEEPVVVAEETADAVEEEEEPKQEKQPITRDELEQLSNQQKTCGEAAARLRDKVQQLLSLSTEYHLPKGTRAVFNHLGHVADAAAATQALADYYLETNEEQKFPTLVESKLKKTASRTFKAIQSQENDMQTALDELENLIKAGEDRVVMNLRSRTIKEMTLTLDDLALKQAMAFSKAADLYSPDKGALLMLSRLSIRVDKAVRASIDNTLHLAGTMLVMTEDASAMLEALDRNDADTMTRLQQKLIDHLYEK